MNQELVREAGRMHQEVEQLEQHLGAIDQELASLEVFYSDLGQLNNRKDNEVLASLGKGVFAPAKIENKEFFVEVGAGIIVEKKPEEVMSIVEKQIEGLRKSRVLFNQQIEIKFAELQETIAAIEKSK